MSLDPEQLVQNVLSEHGISEDDLELRRAADARDQAWCPSCHWNAFDSPRRVANHHLAHENSVMQSICGKVVWRDVLEELHGEDELRPAAIASALPAHTGPQSIRRDLQAFDIYSPRPRSNGGRTGLAGTLDEMSPEDFDAITAGESQ